MDIRELTNEKNEFMRYNHMWVAEGDTEHAIVLADVAPESLNPYGLVHGGVYFSMMDIAAGVVARMDGRRHVTLDASTHFYKSATQGRLIATGQVVHRGRTTCVVNTEVRGEDGTLFSDGAFSMFCVEP